MTRIEQAIRQSLGEIIPEVFRAAEEMRQRRAGAQGQGQQGGGCLLASSDLLISKLLAMVAESQQMAPLFDILFAEEGDEL